jgi:hypothetical protein
VNPYSYEILNFYNKHLKSPERGVPEKRQSSLIESLDQLSRNNDTDFSRHELQKTLTENGPPKPADISMAPKAR